MEKTNPFTNIFFDLLAFVITVVVAYCLKWQSRDVIWGLWICSFTVGYAYIVTGIISSVVNASDSARLMQLITGLFLLGFFTVHFGLFHFVHGVFLNVFFPVMPETSGFPNFFAMLTMALTRFWPLVLTTFLSRVSEFPFSGDTFEQKTMLMKPYASVVRMHLLIFVFAGLTIADMTHYAIYPVLVAYFITWGEIRRRFAKEEES